MKNLKLVLYRLMASAGMGLFSRSLMSLNDEARNVVGVSFQCTKEGQKPEENQTDINTSHRSRQVPPSLHSSWGSIEVTHVTREYYEYTRLPC